MRKGKYYLIIPLFIFLTLTLFGADDKSQSVSKDQSTPKVEHKSHILSSMVLYIPNRILDFFDIAKLNIGIGPGIGAHVQVTEPLQTGLLFYDVVKIGLTGKRFQYYRREASVEFGLSYAYLQEGEIKRNSSEVGGIVQVLILGAEVSINLEEVGDFISGIFFYDAKEDDLYFNKKEKKQREVKVKKGKEKEVEKEPENK